MNKKGQTTVEFALVALLLFAMLFALIDMAVMFYVNLTMQSAVREGARYAITGQGGESAGRRTALINKIKERSNGLYDKNANPQGKEPKVSVLTPADVGSYSNYTGRPVGDTGKPDEIIIVSLNYAWPLLTPILRPFFPGNTYTFTVRATMKNEPWGL
ncbi:MAG: hypothetical protein A2075_18135 [Geobacteraceae bacterium GWC2_58_44]|nr:MAG: hypothetical protein A2075_18135 [Geobacteraceae bacterium GWC2_58_44]HBG04366.1 pilus assembly protein TadE [Geobacter sp.]